jgi:hypothetical protein
MPRRYRQIVLGDDASVYLRRGGEAVRVSSACLLVILTLELAMRSREQTCVPKKRRLVGVDGRVITPMLLGEAGRQPIGEAVGERRQEPAHEECDLPCRKRVIVCVEADQVVVERAANRAQEGRMPTGVLTEAERFRGKPCFDHDLLSVAIEASIQVPDQPRGRGANKYKRANTKR